MIDPGLLPNTAAIVEAICSQWPEHTRFLDQSFARRDEALLQATERTAAAVRRIVGQESLREVCNDYRFLCDRLMEEEQYFRRHQAYRLSRFEDAAKEVYSNLEFMRRYMNFLLLTYVIWDNHARAIEHFEREYLPRLPPNSAHLEIGPGHGLLLHMACNARNVASVTGWDISEGSIRQARLCLEALGHANGVSLALQDLFDAPTGGPQFDSVVLAEVLEHLENPAAALRAVRSHMRPHALMWVHVPINSPAPDHLFLLRTPEEATHLIAEAGFEILDAAFYPMTGQTLERARKHDFTISAAVTARRTDAERHG